MSIDSCTGVTCSNQDEYCVSGACKCGDRPTCVGDENGPYCAAESSACGKSMALYRVYPIDYSLTDIYIFQYYGININVQRLILQGNVRDGSTLYQDIRNVSFHSNTMAKHIMAAQGLTTNTITGDLGVKHMVLRVIWSGFHI